MFLKFLPSTIERVWVYDRKCHMEVLFLESKVPCPHCSLSFRNNILSEGCNKSEEMEPEEAVSQQIYLTLGPCKSNIICDLSPDIRAPPHSQFDLRYLNL